MLKSRHIGQGCVNYSSVAGFGAWKKNLAYYIVVMLLAACTTSFTTNTVFFPQRVLMDVVLFIE